jgi:hypothetical protein
MEETIKAKHNYFMGTIMICVVYGILSILMLSIGYFTTIGNEILFNTLLYFTVTFVIGTIIIILITTIMVLLYEPPDVILATPDLYSNQSCPDYWLYQTSNDISNYGNDVNFNVSLNNTSNVKNYNNSRINDSYMKNTCIPDNTIMLDDSNKRTITTINNNDPTNNDEDFKIYLANMQMGSSNANVSESNICDMIFPEYLAFADNQRYIDSKGTSETNYYRCKYATECSIPWTGAGCD